MLSLHLQVLIKLAGMINCLHDSSIYGLVMSIYLTESVMELTSPMGMFAGKIIEVLETALTAA